MAGRGLGGGDSLEIVEFLAVIQQVGEVGHKPPVAQDCAVRRRHEKFHKHEQFQTYNTLGSL